MSADLIKKARELLYPALDDERTFKSLVDRQVARLSVMRELADALEAAVPKVLMRALQEQLQAELDADEDSSSPRGFGPGARLAIELIDDLLES